MQCTAVKSNVPGAGCVMQVDELHLRIVPLFPTTKHVDVVGQLTPERVALVVAYNTHFGLLFEL